MALPNTYQEVEYIQSSGTQYIDTLHNHGTNTKFEIKFAFQTMTTEWNALCGARTNYMSNDDMDFFVHYRNSAYTMRYGCGGSMNDTWVSVSLDTPYIATLTKDAATLGGTTTSLSTNLTSCSYNDWVFGVCNSGTQVDNLVKAKVYYFKIWDNDVLVRDFVPCYRKSDSVIGLYDLVNDVFYTNNGTGTFTKGPDVLPPTGYKLKKIYIWVPSEYQQVEYIESSGTQYIDTGIIPNNNTKVEMNMGSWNQSGTYNNLFGARYSWSSSGRGFHLGYDSGGSIFFWMFGGNFQAEGLTFNDGNIHSIEMSQSGIYEDGTLKKTISSATFTSPGNMYIFCDNDNGTAAEYGVYKLYYFKIYNSGTLVRDFVPCYRKSDGVIGLYDKVEGKFYANSGTGTFTKGADVTNNIMVEKQVRPPIVPPAAYEISYDLKGGNLSDLQAAGFDEIWTNGQYTFASDGLQQTSSSNDRGIWIIKRGLDLTNAKKLTAWHIGQWQYASWSNGKEIKLGTTIPTGGTMTNPRRDTYFTYSNNSGYRNSELPYVDASGTSTVLARDIATSASGEDTMTLTIDFENKTIEWKVAGTNNYTLSANLTDEQYNATRNMTAMYWGWGRGYSSYDSYERLKEVYLKIEY